MAPVSVPLEDLGVTWESDRSPGFNPLVNTGLAMVEPLQVGPAEEPCGASSFRTFGDACGLAGGNGSAEPEAGVQAQAATEFPTEVWPIQLPQFEVTVGARGVMGLPASFATVTWTMIELKGPGQTACHSGTVQLDALGRGTFRTPELPTSIRRFGSGMIHLELTRFGATIAETGTEQLPNLSVIWSTDKNQQGRCPA